MRNIFTAILIFFTISSCAQKNIINKNGVEIAFSPVHFSNSENIIEKIDYQIQTYSGEAEIKNLISKRKTGFSLGYRFLFIASGQYRNFFKLEYAKNKSNLNFEDHTEHNEDLAECEVDLTNKIFGISNENECFLNKDKKLSMIFGYGFYRSSLNFNEKVKPAFYDQYERENEESCNYWGWKINSGIRYYVTHYLTIFSNAAFLKSPSSEIKRKSYYIGVEKIDDVWYYTHWIAEYKYKFNLNSLDLNFGIAINF